jgi:hypothetical protein
MIMNATRFTMLLQGSSLLRPVRHRALQPPRLNSIGALPQFGDQAFRTVSINPYNGKDYRNEERELQRKKCSHGLKVEWVDFAPTIMERARSRLRESATQRKLAAAKANRSSTPNKRAPASVSPNASQSNTTHQG